MWHVKSEPKNLNKDKNPKWVVERCLLHNLVKTVQTPTLEELKTLFQKWNDLFHKIKTYLKFLFELASFLLDISQFTQN